MGVTLAQDVHGPEDRQVVGPGPAGPDHADDVAQGQGYAHGGDHQGERLDPLGAQRPEHGLLQTDAHKAGDQGRNPHGQEQVQAQELIADPGQEGPQDGIVAMGEIGELENVKDHGQPDGQKTELRGPDEAVRQDLGDVHRSPRCSQTVERGVPLFGTAAGHAAMKLDHSFQVSGFRKKSWKSQSPDTCSSLIKLAA